MADCRDLGRLLIVVGAQVLVLNYDVGFRGLTFGNDLSF